MTYLINTWRTIIEGRIILIFFILWAILSRLILFSISDIKFEEISSQYNIHYLNWTYSLLSNKFVALTVSFFLLVLSAILINIITIGSNLLRYKSLLPSAFAILLFTALPVFSLFPQILICSTIFCYILLRMFFDYNTEAKSELSSAVGFYLSLSTFIAPSLIFYLPILWLVMYKLRQINMKGIIASIIGVIFLYAPLATVLFFTDSFDKFFEEISLYFNLLEFQISITNFTIGQYIIFGFIILMQLFLFIGNIKNLSGNKIRTIENISALVIIECFSIIFIAIFPAIYWSSLAILFVCYSFHVSFFLSSIENKSSTIKLFIFLSVILFASSILTLVII